MTLEQVAEAIFPHPTQSEIFGELARRLRAWLRRTSRKGAKPVAAVPEGASGLAR